MKLCDTVVVVQLFLHCNITNVADHVQFIQSLMLKSVASAYFAAEFDFSVFVFFCLVRTLTDILIAF